MKSPTIQELIETNKARNNGALKCYICSAVLDESNRKSYVKEHKDNNRKNNHPANLDIACRPCNKKKDPGLIAKMHKVKGLTLKLIYKQGQKEILHDKLRIDSMAMAKNVHGEPIFREFAVKILFQKDELLLSDLVKAGSELAGVQEERGYKYAGKMTSLVGDLETFEKDKETWVRLKPSVKNGFVNEFKKKFDR